MCKSQADGGQRCPKEARKTLAAATVTMHDALKAHVDAMLTNAPEETVRELRTAAQDAVAAERSAQVDLASTPTGQRELVAKINESYSHPDSDTPMIMAIRAEWFSLIAEGNALREENDAIAREVRLNRHPRADEARAVITDIKAQGFEGNHGINRTLSTLGVHFVKDDPYLCNVVAEQFGLAKDRHGKRTPTNGVPNPAIPARVTPPPMSTNEFDATYAPIRERSRGREPLARDVLHGSNATHWWSIVHDNDGSTTYRAGVNATAATEFIVTQRPWTTGKESVTVTDNRHLDFDPATYASR